MSKLNLSVQYADTSHNWGDVLPRPLLRRWVKAALQVDAALTIRFVDEVEGRRLNAEFRGKDYPTNVLTFTYDDDINELPEEVRAAIAADEGEQIEADIILCGAVLQREAAEQGKTIIEHAAHLVVHGVLHAQGFDHIEDEEAEIMENLETQIVQGLGFVDPYAAERQGAQPL
ncbi:rRNA maturation RNase YbeY [Hydromonas duriensis]|uniref:Endoribonuclease YbeY n=1 Tax=Hydromonas duriensis TaxID=1527608 RepID=A0A4R6Y2K0_9BURK|nr:rRNA maturation RNase YbeY [Hydromonas duriensis]TDR30760.1 putative rRNA maturation factor [Hydromonas duriensis]